VNDYTEFFGKRVIKIAVQKVMLFSKNSSVTSCHLFLPLPEGKYPEGGMGRENRGGTGDSS